MRSIDMKSILIGGLLAALVLCMLGGTTVGPESYGRYQIETNPDYAFVLDTTTGQVWSTQATNDIAGIFIDPNSAFSLPKLW
jgi:hypothetical protein